MSTTSLIVFLPPVHYVYQVIDCFLPPFLCHLLVSLLVVLTRVLEHRVPLSPPLDVLTRVLEHRVPLSPPLDLLTRVLEHLVPLSPPHDVLTRVLKHLVPLLPLTIVQTPYPSPPVLCVWRDVDRFLHLGHHD